jgi:hypothetical protein
MEMKKMNNQKLSNAWKNFEINEEVIMKGNKIGGIKQPDTTAFVIRASRTMPGMQLVAEFETEQEAMNHLRMLVGV